MATTPNRATRRSGTTGASKAKTTRSTSSTAKKPSVPKPVGDDAVTLADIDAEASEATTEIQNAKPFKLNLGEDENGEAIKIQLAHPGTLPYEVVSSGDHDAVLASAMSDEDYEAFLDAGFTSIQATVVFKMWRQHYGLLRQPGE